MNNRVARKVSFNRWEEEIILILTVVILFFLVGYFKKLVVSTTGWKHARIMTFRFVLKRPIFGFSMMSGSRQVHEGYPKSLVEFAKREFWHGKGDATSIKPLFQSKVAMVALIFVALHVALTIFSVVGNG